MDRARLALRSTPRRLPGREGTSVALKCPHFALGKMPRRLPLGLMAPLSAAAFEGADDGGASNWIGNRASAREGKKYDSLRSSCLAAV